MEEELEGFAEFEKEMDMDEIDMLIDEVNENNECKTFFPTNMEAAIIGSIEHYDASRGDTIQSLVLDKRKCIEILMSEGEQTEEEAWDDFYYNTMRSLPYQNSEGITPVFFTGINYY